MLLLGLGADWTAPGDLCRAHFPGVSVEVPPSESRRLPLILAFPAPCV